LRVLRLVNPELRKLPMNHKDEVAIPREILEIVLESARALHPKETIFLLRGKKTGNSLSVTELLVPPTATYGNGFSGFPMHMMPIDFSIVGTVHSHPSGNLAPSSGDLNHSMGRVIIILAFPYQTSENVAAYNRDGKKLNLQVI
jgi:proteasome lid subunit RPN8/RPN11